MTADGAIVRASADENTDLFWAVRGGSGAFGVVVSLEIDLLPYPDVFAGMLVWDASRAPVSRAWAEWTATAPEAATTTLRVLHFPPMPELPPFLSGRSLVVVDGAILETDAAASALLAPLRARSPRWTHSRGSPQPGWSRCTWIRPTRLRRSPRTPCCRCRQRRWKRSSRPQLTALHLELRHLGGAIARRPVHGGAVASLAGEYLLGAIAMIPAPELAAAAVTAVHDVVAALGEWHADALALTFVDGGGVDRRAGFGDSAVRLEELKRAFDPVNMFAAGHPVA